MATKQKPKPAKAAKPQGTKKAAKPPAKAPKALKAAAKAVVKAVKATKLPPKSKTAVKKAALPTPPKKAAPPPPPPKKPAAATGRKAAAPPKTPAGSPTPPSPPPSSAPSKSTPTLSASSPTNGGIRYLTAQDVIELHKAVSTEFGGNQAHPGVIESQFGLLNAVQRPQLMLLGRDAYPTFAEKAAAFVFALLQARPFRGGNRRVALASLIAFCELNAKTFDSRVFDEKTAEQLFKRAGGFRELGIPPENVFRELKETLGRSIVAA